MPYLYVSRMRYFRTILIGEIERAHFTMRLRGLIIGFRWIWCDSRPSFGGECDASTLKPVAQRMETNAALMTHYCSIHFRASSPSHSHRSVLGQSLSHFCQCLILASSSVNRRSMGNLERGYVRPEKLTTAGFCLNLTRPKRDFDILYKDLGDLETVGASFAHAK